MNPSTVFDAVQAGWLPESAPILAQRIWDLSAARAAVGRSGRMPGGISRGRSLRGRRVAAGSEHNAAVDPDHALGFGLERILDGIAELIERRREQP
ncbi:hypothetical protein [Nocardia farcinica]|uniref:hypothetical protein n=1 Tax=Nocardia farcinica TaxID=37329 RepID=UPI002456E1CE|nr:hypothetical protein [Nocardia farcinica]